MAVASLPTVAALATITTTTLTAIAALTTVAALVTVTAALTVGARLVTHVQVEQSSDPCHVVVTYGLLQLLRLVRVVEDRRVLAAAPPTLPRHGEGRRGQQRRRARLRHAQVVARARGSEADPVHLAVVRHLDGSENDG